MTNTQTDPADVAKQLESVTKTLRSLVVQLNAEHGSHPLNDISDLISRIKVFATHAAQSKSRDEIDDIKSCLMSLQAQIIGTQEGHREN
jgi:flagellin-specific chaperone FliS